MTATHRRAKAPESPPEALMFDKRASVGSKSITSS